MSADPRRSGTLNASMLVKHSLSCLQDVLFDVTIDHDDRVVTVASDVFDSSLLGWLATQILPAEHAVEVFRDDDSGWNPPLPPYRLRVRVGGGIEFGAQVVKLTSATGGGVAVQLIPPRPRHRPQRGGHEPQGSGGTP